jgi:tRNA A37 threonylcarbamoyladenosine synthetase subunit TsaC/SUA5/YrdC
MPHNEQETVGVSAPTLNINENRDRQYAANLLHQGFPVASFNRDVAALWIDANNPNAFEALCEIKGDSRKKQPVALAMPWEKIIDWVDLDNIHPDLKFLFETKEPHPRSNELTERLGYVAFCRVPIKKSAAEALPSWVVSYQETTNTYHLQNWDPHGHKPTSNFLNAVKAAGTTLIGVTSFNRSGAGSIIDQVVAEQLAKEVGISFLHDPKETRPGRGSFSILGFGPDGVKVIRPGNIPSTFLNGQFENGINLEGEAENHHDIPQEIEQIEDPHIRRIAVLLYLRGRKPDHIVKFLTIQQ